MPRALHKSPTGKQEFSGLCYISLANVAAKGHNHQAPSALLYIDILNIHTLNIYKPSSHGVSISADGEYWERSDRATQKLPKLSEGSCTANLVSISLEPRIYSPARGKFSGRLYIYIRTRIRRMRPAVGIRWLKLPLARGGPESRPFSEAKARAD